MKVYISIPISNYPIYTQKIHANNVAKAIAESGHEPVNPFDTPPPPEGLTTEEEYAYYMGEDIKKLLLCDAIFMCEGWAYSKGCCMEKALAHINNMIIINSKEQLAKL